MLKRLSEPAQPLQKNFTGMCVKYYLPPLRSAEIGCDKAQPFRFDDLKRRLDVLSPDRDPIVFVPSGNKHFGAAKQFYLNIGSADSIPGEALNHVQNGCVNVAERFSRIFFLRQQSMAYGADATLRMKHGYRNAGTQHGGYYSLLFTDVQLTRFQVYVRNVWMELFHFCFL
jgi:hypothetical protein